MVAIAGIAPRLTEESSTFGQMERPRRPGVHDVDVPQLGTIEIDPTRAAGTAVAVRAGWTPYRPMILALLSYVLIRGAVMFNGYLYADDFALRYWAHTSSLTPEYLFRSYYGHVQPFGQLAGWLLQAGFPGSFTALMVWSLAMQVVTFALLWRIILHLTGSNLAAFLAFLIPAFSMFGFETGVWWVEITETVPYALFMMISVWSLIRALEGRPGRWWLWSAVAFLAAMISISKGTVGLIALFMIAAALPVGVPRRRGIIAALRLSPRYWLAVTVPTVAYAVFLRIHAPVSHDPDWQLVRALRYARDLFFLNIVPGAAGGPWVWFSAQGETWPGVLVIPRYSTVLLVVAPLLLLAVVALVRLYRPNLFVYLMWMVGYAAFITAIAAYGRGGAVVASTGYRYTFDFWIPLAFFAGLLFFGVKGEADPFPPRTIALVERLRGRGITRPVVAAAAAAMFIVSSLISAVEPALRWVNSQTKEYVATAQQSVVRTPRTAQFLPQKTMTDLVHPYLMLPFASTEVVFSPDPVFRPFSESSTDGLFGFDPSGNAEQQFVPGIQSEPPAEVCGYTLGATPVVIPMTTQVPQWSYVAEVSYLSSADTSVEMTIGPDTRTVPVRPGLHNVFFEVDGPVDEVTARAPQPGVDVCIDRVNIGPRLGPGTKEALYPPPEWPLPQGESGNQ